MARTRDLKTTQERSIRALQLRPEIGKGTARTVARSRPGQVATDVTDADHRLLVDLGPESGGHSLGPDPGVLIRGGLAACLAGGYQLWAAHRGVVLDDVEVIVEADMDARGMYGVDDSVPPGYTALRVTVNIVSQAPTDLVREVVEYADRHSPLLYDVTTALPLNRDIRITTPIMRED